MTRRSRSTHCCLAMMLFVLFGATASADAPAQFAMPGVQAPQDPRVDGLRFVFLYGDNTSVKGLDLGFAAFSRAGVQSGLTFNLGISAVSQESTGMPWALVNLHAGRDRGVNVAFINLIEAAQGGANVGFVNVTSQASSFDFGGLNLSDEADVQFGMLNATDDLRGLQIGLLNFAPNGFLPVFPLFNFPKR